MSASASASHCSEAAFSKPCSTCRAQLACARCSGMRCPGSPTARNPKLGTTSTSSSETSSPPGAPMADLANDGFESYYAEKAWELIPAVYRHEDGIAERPGVLRA